MYDLASRAHDLIPRNCSNTAQLNSTQLKTPINVNSANMANCSRAPCLLHGQSTDVAGVSPPWLLKTSTKSPYIAVIRISATSSVGTIFVAVPAPSANISSQFIMDTDRCEGISRSLDMKQFVSK